MTTPLPTSTLFPYTTLFRSQMDTLIAFTPACEQRAAAVPNSTAVELSKRLKSYDGALRDFRLAIGLPVKERSEEHTSELQSRENLVCRLLLEKKKNQKRTYQ